MRIHPGSLRHSLAVLLVFTGTLAGIAPGASAQTLIAVVGEPIPYRVSVPEAWRRERAGRVLFAASANEELVMMATAADLAAGQGQSASMPARKAGTERFMSSDSFLLETTENLVVRSFPHPLSEVVREIGRLGGEKAACVCARTRIDGEEGWMRLCSTIKDAVLYTLVFQGKGELRPEQEPLMARIRDSFVLADAPENAASAP